MRSTDLKHRAQVRALGPTWVNLGTIMVVQIPVGLLEYPRESSYGESGCFIGMPKDTPMAQEFLWVHVGLIQTRAFWVQQGDACKNFCKSHTYKSCKSPGLMEPYGPH